MRYIWFYIALSSLLYNTIEHCLSEHCSALRLSASPFDRIIRQIVSIYTASGIQIKRATLCCAALKTVHVIAYDQAVRISPWATAATPSAI